MSRTVTPNSVPKSTIVAAGVAILNPFARGGTVAAILPWSRCSAFFSVKRIFAGASTTNVAAAIHAEPGVAALQFSGISRAELRIRVA